MKRLLILGLLIVLSACTSRTDDNVFIWEESIENPFYGETLTIAVRDSRWAIEPIRRFAELYMTKNPGVEIEAIAFDIDPELAREQLRVQLMAGQSPNLMAAEIVNLRSREFFVDWMPLIEAHPGLNDDEWFMDAIFALAEDSKLFYFPETISFYYISGNMNVPGLSDVLESKQTVSINDMLKIYMDFGGPSTGLGMSFSDLAIINSLWFTQDFVDFDSGFVDFANPRFIYLLEEFSGAMKPFPESVMNEMMHLGDWRFLLAEYFMFNVEGFPPIDNLLYGDSSFGNSMLFTNNCGELLVFSVQGTWALSSATTNIQRALAIDFLRFTQDSTIDEVREIRDTAGAIFLGVVPLNRARFEHNLRRDMYRIVAGYEFRNHLIKPRHAARDYLIDRIYYAMNLPMAVMPNVPMSIVSFFNETLESLNLGLISPHEAATALQNRVVLEILEGN